MRKQRISYVAIIASLLLLTATSALAQSSALKANVPFDFQINGKTMTAGEYTLTEPVSPQRIIIIRCRENGTAAAANIMTAYARELSNKTELVFRRYGNEYFLAKIHVQGQTRGVELPKSKAERRLIKELGSRYLAGRQVEPEIVTVALAQ